MAISMFLLVVGFVLLIKGADYLVEGASSLALRFKISELVIGLTLVAFGTSGPELFVNIVASIKGSEGLILGNILGSNIANIFLVLGVSTIIYPLVVSKETLFKQIPFALFAVFLLGILANDNFFSSRFSYLSRIDGGILLILFLGFIFYSFRISRNIYGLTKPVQKTQFSVFKSFFLVVAGLLGLGLGAKLIVDNGVNLARVLKVSDLLIGLTVVAIGTSLPELATSAVAACKKNSEIAIGNVVGSNIFNILLVLGTSSIIRPLPYRQRNNFDLGVVILASLLLFLFLVASKKYKLARWKGILFLWIYISYIISHIFLRNIF